MHAKPERLDEVMERLPALFRERLSSMYRNERQRGCDGALHEIDTTSRISPTQGMCLHDFCVSARPLHTLEIGLAYGYSAIFILAALKSLGGGHHMAVDPYQQSQWKGVGMTHGQELTGPDSGVQFTHISDRSSNVLVELNKTRRRFQLIFIDGNHRFDDVIVDFCLSAQLCVIGGHIALDDIRMPSVSAALSFIRTNRTDFSEVSTESDNMAVFTKIAWDLRPWDHFVPFHDPVELKK